MRLAALTVLAALVLAAPAGAAVSFTDVEDEVMCTVCGTPLNLAPQDAPFAQRERAYIRRLIDQGATKQQIKDGLVREYGEQVLALPRDRGFNLVAYVVPFVVILAAAGMLLFALGRWRRPGEPAVAAPAEPPAISAADSRRLDDDLARHDA